jgi:hypothetical protein
MQQMVLRKAAAEGSRTLVLNFAFRDTVLSEQMGADAYVTESPNGCITATEGNGNNLFSTFSRVIAESSCSRRSSSTSFFDVSPSKK